MRLQGEQVKQLILSLDRDVREAAVYYFSRSFSQDPDIMPMAIQAIERLGKNDAFEYYSFLKDLVQTDETLLWLICQVAHNPLSEEYSYEHAIRLALQNADVSVLQQHLADVLNFDGLSDESKKAITERVSFHSESPEEVWRLLDDFCRRADASDCVPDTLDVAENLIGALGKHREFSVSKVLEILDGTPKDNWLELCAVQLAGELRLPEAIPGIVPLFKDADDWMYEVGNSALVRIGGDKVVDQLVEAYGTGTEDLRITAIGILEHIHTDSSVEGARILLETEEYPFLCGQLLQAMLMNFSAEAIEPARQFVLQSPLDPDVIEVRNDLLTACKCMGETFPEFDTWTEDAKHDREFHRKWYREHALVPNFEDFVADETEEAYTPPPPPPMTLVRDIHIGRNDPCPCGSGKKFKKCCLNSRNVVVETL